LAADNGVMDRQVRSFGGSCWTSLAILAILALGRSAYKQRLSPSARARVGLDQISFEPSRCDGRGEFLSPRAGTIGE
jgi:hypothetical protein